MIRRSARMVPHRPSRRGIIYLVLFSLFYSVSGDCMAAINHSFQYDCLRPSACSANWTALTISDDTFENLSSSFLQTCSKLIDLFLRNVKLNVLNPSTLRGLSSLQSFITNEVALFSLSPSVFKHVPRLTEVIISRGKTERLNGESFKPCAELRVLEFDNTPLKYLESFVFSDCGVTLKRLRIRSGKLGEIDSTTFGRLTSLRLLDLTSNRLVTLKPRSFSDLSDLRSLVLRGNFIGTIDVDAFQGLTALTKLDLTKNRITELNVAMLTRMPFLEQLKLSGNRIVSLDLKFTWPDRSLSLLVDNNRLLCRPLVKLNKIRLVGIPDDLPFCADPKVTNAPKVALIREKSPKHQMLSAVKGKDSIKDSEKNERAAFVAPTWIFVWAISMTVGFVIACCVLVFIFLNRRKAIIRRRKEQTGQTLPLNTQTSI